ncbi:Kinesin-like protein kif23 [Rhizophlyctis rosea]|nr:Kinesin-like protein kif23 [Rhizophlyctis rosea]
MSQSNKPIPREAPAALIPSQPRVLKRKASDDLVIEIGEPDGLMPVSCRLRPVQPGVERFIKVINDCEITVVDPTEATTTKAKAGPNYYFGGRVFTESSSQSDVYSSILHPFVDQMFAKIGFAGLVLAYGASNSGKTYTTKGTHAEPGLIVRAAEAILNLMREQNTTLDVASSKWGHVQIGENETVPTDGKPKYAFFLSLAEIYCEQVYDLLRSNDPSELPASSQRDFDFSLFRKEEVTELKRPTSQLKKDANGRMYIENQEEIRVHDIASARKIIEEARRSVNATNVNEESSRSHLFCGLKVVRIPTSADGTVMHEYITTSRIAVVDLAGAERIHMSGVEGRGHLETKDINKSLHTLSMCVEALRENQKKTTNRRVVPWRDSKLTQLLQPYFEHGQARFLVNVNPDISQASVTANVLRFAQKAGALHIAKIAKGKSGQDTTDEKAALQIRVHELEQQLSEALRAVQDREWEVRRECNEEMQRVLGESEARFRRRREEDREAMEKLMDQKLDLQGKEVERLTKLLKSASASNVAESEAGSESEETNALQEEVTFWKSKAQQVEAEFEGERRRREESQEEARRAGQAREESADKVRRLTKENEALIRELEKLKEELRNFGVVKKSETEEQRQDVYLEERFENEGVIPMEVKDETEARIRPATKPATKRRSSVRLASQGPSIPPPADTDKPKTLEPHSPDFATMSPMPEFGAVRRIQKKAKKAGGLEDGSFVFGGGGEGGDEGDALPGWLKPLKSGKVVGREAKVKKGRRAVGKSQVRLKEVVGEDGVVLSQGSKKGVGMFKPLASLKIGIEETNQDSAASGSEGQGSGPASEPTASTNAPGSGSGSGVHAAPPPAGGEERKKRRKLHNKRALDVDAILVQNGEVGGVGYTPLVKRVGRNRM